MIAYTDLVIEHHKAIMNLLEQKIYGSAFALVRIQFEAFMRGNWLIGCASRDDVRRIAAKEFDFPAMHTLASACDAAFGTDRFFQTIKKQAWKSMNSYTHSGIRQLTRRFNGGKIEPNYRDHEIREVIDASTTTVLLQAKLFCMVVGKRAEADQVERLIFEFAPDAATQS